MFWEKLIQKNIHFFVRGSHSIQKLFIQKRFLLIHSKKIFIFLKTGVSARAIQRALQVLYMMFKQTDI